MVSKIRELKPSLKKSGSDDTSDVKPALAYDSNSDIIMFAEESWFRIILRWLKSVVTFLALSIPVALVLYTVISLTLLFGTIVDGKAMVVARGVFLGGIPAVEEVVIASPTDPTSNDIFHRLQVAFLGVPNAQVAVIKSGPHDSITTDGSNITVTGETNATYEGIVKTVDGKNAQFNGYRLKNQYLAECVSGACEPGTFIVIEASGLYGSVKNLGQK